MITAVRVFFLSVCFLSEIDNWVMLTIPLTSVSFLMAVGESVPRPHLIFRPLLVPHF